VPSIAIREGVHKSLDITADHFAEGYGKRARFFIYNSKSLHELESFSSDSGINVMIINIQAFNARGADNRRIYDELDDFQSRKPIDVIAANRPILILDEPQKMEGKATLEALPKFKPLMTLRYSATHKTVHNKIHRLDALDAYNQKLVKKIAVRGIQVKGLTGTNAYLYLEAIEVSKSDPVARIEMEVKLKTGEIKRQRKRLDKNTDLHAESNGLDQYKGFVISQIDARSDTVEFTNGVTLQASQAIGNVNEKDMRRIQIRETIKAHLEKERQLFPLGIKVLSLFFIDEVAKYRDYSAADEKGEYARLFEEEYHNLRQDVLSELDLSNDGYRKHLEKLDAPKTHNGYFSIDKKSKRFVDSEGKGEEKTSDDVDAYDLILKDKERLLSFEESTRFIFSHSALREGWDNPNVFVMCMLKHSNNKDTRRQEVGRGLRLCVNRSGDRIDNPETVHDINLLTVIASESYKSFVDALQKEMVEALSERPRLANEEFFTGKVLSTESGPLTITPAIAKTLYRYLVKNDYTDNQDHITDAFHEAKAEGKLAPLPPELIAHTEQVIALISTVFTEGQIPAFTDASKIKFNRLNSNFDRQEFKELWSRINRKAVYKVDFSSAELVSKCVSALESQLRVQRMQYAVKSGEQVEALTDGALRSGAGFLQEEQATLEGGPVSSEVRYDLLGRIAEAADLTRNTVAAILTSLQAQVFNQFYDNPEHFIAEASRIINEQKAAMVIERLSYDALEQEYGVEIFTRSQVGQDFSGAVGVLQRHVFDYAVLQSKPEREFAQELESSPDVAVYAKLPRGFLIPTPVGDYNPDWAVAFQKGSVRHIYFVAETKGTMSTLVLRPVEQSKIACAKKFFSALGSQQSTDKIRYDVLTSYGDLLRLVRSE
jgi:type III restriction enzyme